MWRGRKEVLSGCKETANKARPATAGLRHRPRRKVRLASSERSDDNTKNTSPNRDQKPALGRASPEWTTWHGMPSFSAKRDANQLSRSSTSGWKSTESARKFRTEVGKARLRSETAHAATVGESSP